MTGGGIAWVTGQDNVFRQRFRQLLLSVPTRDLAAGWQLAVDLGRPVAPMLWDMVRREDSDVTRRLTVMVAAVLAGGPNEDERLFSWLNNQKPMLEERTMAGLLLAMGPQRAHPVDNFWGRLLGGAKTQGQLLPIAIRLAAARFPETATGAATILGNDPGLPAASAFAGLPVPATIATRWWKGKVEDHATLFWRGALLGAAARYERAQNQDQLIDQARQLVSMSGDTLSEVRVAAALLLARSRSPLTDPRPDWRVLQAMVFDVASAEAVRNWLGPSPQSLNESPQRLAVAYALSRPPREVVETRDKWGADSRVNRHVAIALAWRLLGAPDGGAIDAKMPKLAEWNFVRWASGSTFDHAAEFEDPVLQAIGRLLADGRMPKKALRSALEEALWRWGSHPGLVRLEQEHLLVRDLLLSGSDPGGGRYQPHVPPHARYLPSGFDSDHDFFKVAVEAYEFLSRPRMPIPAEYRLR